MSPQSGKNEQDAWQSLPEWQKIQQWQQQQDEAKLNQLHDELQRHLRENGATFDPWRKRQRQLDLLPWLVSDTDWQHLEAGLAQRQRLLAAVLVDLYGEQQLLQQGIIPSDVILQNKHYLLPCHQLLQQPQKWLPLLAIDVGRDEQGQFCVFADNTQMPAGLGYVLEHRLAFNRTTVDLNTEVHKAQIAGFFRQLQSLLRQGNQANVLENNGLVGLLTHHTRDAAYFENAYLANYLDIGLIRGADLMYKDGRIWLKTLTGLQPLESLLRYKKDASCDPLELEPDTLGCAGTLQAIRQQNLFCANPPGVSLLDSGALLPFMDKLCQHLLAEELILPSVPALWCGNPDNLPQIKEQFSSYHIHQLDSGDIWAPSQLTSTEQKKLWLKIQQRPEIFIARKLLSLSKVPCWPGPVQSGCLRLFSILDATEQSHVLPGALGRINPQPEGLQNPAIKEINAKDVWVLADREQVVSLLQSTKKRLLLSRHTGMLPSRVADHLFWLGRYNERLNLICRSLRAALPMLANFNSTEQGQDDVRRFLSFCVKANSGHLPEGPLTKQVLAETLIQLFSVQNPLSVATVLKNLLYNAQSVREYFSDDTWYVLDKLQSVIYQWPEKPQWHRPTALQRLLDDVIMLQTSIYGLNNETMSRTQTWRFMDVGQHLERALQTATLLQEVFVSQATNSKDHAANATLMETLLRMADTLMTYRRRYRTELHPMAIIDLLLLDDTTPRSVGYQCTRLTRQIHKLPTLSGNAISLNREERYTIELMTLLQLAEPETLFDEQLCATPQLAELLKRLQELLRKLSDSITLSYFSHADMNRSWQSF